MSIERLLTNDVRTEPGARSPVDADDILAGSPEVVTIPLASLGAAEFGIWEITTGTVRDTEADEIFVVLSGSGAVGFEDGSSIELSEGVAVRLQAGDRTVWRVEETLRKVYFAV